MSNSALVDYTKISPNKSTRNHKIDTITIHCTAAQCTIESLGSLFSKTSTQSSSNYGIDLNGKIGMFVEEHQRSWCSSSRSNDNRAITIEVSSDSFHPYKVKEEAYKSLIDLLVDICLRNDIEKLVWSFDKNERINHLNGCNMTVHRDFANKECPGDYLYNLHPLIAQEVNERLEDERMDIDKFLNEITDEQLVKFYKRLDKALSKQSLPSTWNAKEELQEAIDLGITDGSNPMSLTPRYQTAIMVKRNAKKKK